MKLAILDLCVWLREYQHDQDKFGDVVATWARRGLPEAEFSVISIVEGAAFPQIADFHGFILTGSDKGVYDDTFWMASLREFLQQVRAAEKPIFGICFGHQIMADVFGGKAEKVGPAEVGVRSYKAADGTPIKGHVWHQDQVTEVPPGAKVIASAEYCPVAALSYDFPAMSVQFHPEYAPDYVSTFLSRSRGEVLSAEAADDAIAQFDESDVDPDLFAQDVAAFFRGAVT